MNHDNMESSTMAGSAENIETKTKTVAAKPANVSHVSYAKELSKKQIMRLREITSQLPSYVSLFLRSIEETTQPRTRIAYAYDIKFFFDYLHDENPALKNKAVEDISLEDLNQLTALDF